MDLSKLLIELISFFSDLDRYKRSQSIQRKENKFFIAKDNGQRFNFSIEIDTRKRHQSILGKYNFHNSIHLSKKYDNLYKKMNSNDLSNDISHIPLNDNFRAIKKLNLKNLLMGIIPSKEKLKWILTCCESVHTLHGSAILSQIYSYVTFLGNQSFLNNVLNEVIKPFIGFILNWIKYGEIQDPYNEFFILIKNSL